MSDRRTFLRAGALLAAAGVLACEDTSKSAAPLGSVGPKSSAKKSEVIVIGAGMAGLAAARDLKKAGKQVLVLEGRDRAGGRIWTDRSLGTPFDLGASWIHGTRGNPLTKLAKRAGAKTKSSSYTDVHLYDHDGKRLGGLTMAEIAIEWAALQKEAEAAAEEADADISYDAAIKRALAGEKLSAEERRALDWVLATQQVATGEDLSKLSIAFDDEAFGGGDRLFPGGYDQLIKLVGQGLDVRLGHRVSRVSHGAKGVEITTDKGVFKAERAIVTVPLGVLKRGSIAFAPGLGSKKLAAVRTLGMGTLNKVVLLFPKVFWPGDRDFLGYMSKRAGEYPVFLNGHKLMGANALMAFTGGSFARGIEGLPDKRIIDRIMVILRAMFGTKAVAPSQFKIARWTRDPFAHGSYSHVPVGAASGKHHQALAEPIGDRLFFAGEATEHDYSSTVHGALMSGMREAKRILAL